MGKSVDIKSFTKLVIATAHGAHSTRYPETPSLEELQTMGGNGWVRSGLRPACELTSGEVDVLEALKEIVAEFDKTQYTAGLGFKNNLVLRMVDTKNAGPNTGKGVNALSIKLNLFIHEAVLCVGGPKIREYSDDLPKFHLYSDRPIEAKKGIIGSRQDFINFLAEEMGRAASNYARRGVWTAALAHNKATPGS